LQESDPQKNLVPGRIVYYDKIFKPKAREVGGGNLFEITLNIEGLVGKSISSGLQSISGKKGEIVLNEFSSLEVKVHNNDLEKAMKVLKKKLQKDGLFRRLKAKRSYEKPSECRRRKRRESERRQRTAQLKKNRNFR
jgi:small subunit ribosomal protein S21